jgi:hypothetical protein
MSLRSNLMNEKENLWMYADGMQQQIAAGSLVTFGAEIFKRAKIIHEFELLKTLNVELTNKSISPMDTRVHEFIFEYLIDNIKILIFFENYLKAELITQNYCIHTIDSNCEGFKQLAKEQLKRPVSLKEIYEIENFIVDEKLKTISHVAIKDKTIGLNILLTKPAYYMCIKAIDINLIEILRKMNVYRNQLHFNLDLQFNLSKQLLDEIELLNSFVDKTIGRLVKK